MSEQKHSPLPWCLSPAQGWAFRDAADKFVGDAWTTPADEALACANAALIVEAVNSHAALKAEREERMVYISPGYAEQAIANLKEKVDALKAERDAAIALLKELFEWNSVYSPREGEYDGDDSAISLCNRVRAAIRGPQ